MPRRPKFSRCAAAEPLLPVALSQLQLSPAAAAVVPLRVGEHRQFRVAAAAAVAAPQATAATAQAAYFSAKPVKSIAWNEISQNNVHTG